MNVGNVWLETCVFNCAMGCQIVWDDFVRKYHEIMKAEYLTDQQKAAMIDVELDKAHKAMAREWVVKKGIYDNPTKVPDWYKQQMFNNLPINAVF